MGGGKGAMAQVVHGRYKVNSGRYKFHVICVYVVHYYLVLPTWATYELLPTSITLVERLGKKWVRRDLKQNVKRIKHLTDCGPKKLLSLLPALTRTERRGSGEEMIQPSCLGGLRCSHI